MTKKPKIYPEDGWVEASIAWAVCQSLHRDYCKGRDPFYKTRQKDLKKHLENARQHIKSKGQAK